MLLIFRDGFFGFEVARHQNPTAIADGMSLKYWLSGSLQAHPTHWPGGWERSCERDCDAPGLNHGLLLTHRKFTMHTTLSFSHSFSSAAPGWMEVGEQETGLSHFSVPLPRM